MKKISKKIIILVLIPIIISLIYLITNGFKVLINYCNAFFISGAIMFLLGALLWVGAAGTFDIFGYSFSSLAVTFSKKGEKKYDNFWDYVETKKESRKKKEKIHFYFMIIGCCFIFLAIVIRFFV